MSNDTNKPPLTEKQQLFLDALVGEAKGNHRKAMEIAGYSPNTGINDVALSGSTVTLTANITTAGDSDDTGGDGTDGAVIITGAALIEPASGVTIDTSSSDGSVTFSSTVNSDANKTLTISSGGGAVDFAGVIGGVAGDHLTGLSINAQGSSTGTGTIDILQIGDTTGTEYGVEGTVTTVSYTHLTLPTKA